MMRPPHLKGSLGRREAQGPEIGDYAIVGDCRTAALVSNEGSIDWLCLPHFSGSSCFAALLDRDGGGHFAICPTAEFTSVRRYRGATAVLETTFSTETGTVRLIDAMLIPTRRGGLEPMRELLRIVEGVEGDVELAIRCEPRPDYARRKAQLKSRGRIGYAFTFLDELILLRSEAPLVISADGTAVIGSVHVSAGDTVRLSLSYVKGEIGVVVPLGEAADLRLRNTEAWWETWSGRCTYVGPHRDAVIRSAVTLKLMTFALSGAVVAAPTTSLPEALGAGRNWDYRFCWLRDAALTMRAFIGLGLLDEAASFLRWLLHATRLTWPNLQIMYDVYGRVDLKEEELTHLAGYRGSRPVRIGNGAHDQIQHDIYGGVITAALDFVEAGGRLQPAEAKLLAGLGETVIGTWREPDHGIWEIRDPKRQYTFSKVMCWAALDGLLRLGRKGMVAIDVDRLTHERDAIAEVVESRGFDTQLGSYVSELDGDHLDAAILLMVCIGYKDANDPRARSTAARIQQRLGRGGLIYRYESGYDCVPSQEGAFGICSFWAVDGSAKRGEVEEAEGTFQHVLTFGNDLGLFAEEIDVETGGALGNFPQAFTHVGLINAALAIASARRAGECR